MAKIESVTLESIPKEIHVNDKFSDITVLTVIKFHPLDLKFEMEYCLNLFVYDIHGQIDIPIIIANWDESHIQRISHDRKDDFMGKTTVIVKADETQKEVRASLALRLGNQTKSSSSYSRKLDVFATLIPAIERASKWSAPFESKIVF
ncbi:hypothetical protein [Ulvibacter antarcticus]|uniref:Uncharacterized protein n=1 Tax=Ulvibacter antarcticus TaxID=442714 RepID=A0A3L9YD64_9FLAO|nr:hypothetical protein [Ulvibacter antarcticus]RMA58591.1 hypothetical protein BXY75_1964 [Ulvibacter antarcticus]